MKKILLRRAFAWLLIPGFLISGGSLLAVHYIAGYSWGDIQKMGNGTPSSQVHVVAGPKQAAPLPTPSVAKSSTPKATTTPKSAPRPAVVPLPAKSQAGPEITAANIIVLVNDERIDAGLQPLKENPTLDAIAAAKLADMEAKGYFAHYSPTGTGPRDWLLNGGYNYQWGGENLARYYHSSQETVAAWMLSPLHKANILKPEYTETGVAVSGNVVVQFFANPLKNNL